MNKETKYSFLIFSTGGVPIYSFPSMEEKQNLFSSLVSAISALGDDVLEEQSKREKLEFGNKNLFLLEREELFFGLVSRTENDKKGWDLIETLADKFLTRFGSNTDWLTSHIQEVQQFEEVAEFNLKKTDESPGEVDKLLEEADDMLKELEEDISGQYSLIERAKKIADEVGLVTTGYLTQQLSIGKQDFYKVVLPRLNLIASQDEDTFYSPSFWTQQKERLRKLLKEKKKLTLVEIEQQLDIQKSDIPSLLDEVDTNIKKRTIFSRELIQEAQKLLDSEGHLAIQSLASALGIASNEIRDVIFPHLDKVSSQTSETVYSKKFWRNRKNHLKRNVRETPASLHSLSDRMDIPQADIRRMVTETELILFDDTIYLHEQQLVPSLKEKVRGTDLQGIPKLLNKVNKQNEGTALEIITSILSPLKEKLEWVSLERINGFFKQLWQMEDTLLLRIVDGLKSVLKEKLKSVSLERITHFIESMNYTSLKASSKLLEELKNILIQEERFQNATILAIKEFLHPLELANKEIAQEVAGHVPPYVGAGKVKNATLSEIGWLLHRLNEVNPKAASEVVNSIKSQLAHELKDKSPTEMYSFFKALEGFPDGMIQILEHGQEQFISTLNRSSRQEKYDLLDFLKSTVKPQNKKLYEEMKERIMDHIYFES